MSPRRPAVLRDSDGRNLRDHLIAAAARLIGLGAGTRISVRDIAREAQVADGALYNYFEDKEDLLAHGLLAHVAAAMASEPLLPPAGTGALADNLAAFIDRGLAVLMRVMPAFAGLLAQPAVLHRFRAMVGGDAAFGAGGEDGEGSTGGGHGLPGQLTGYLRAEQRLGRVDPAADVGAASSLIVGAIHGQVLPPLLLSPPGTPLDAPPGFAGRLAGTILSGIRPGPGPGPAGAG
jgi:AcrR family transcriptional regulator